MIENNNEQNEITKEVLECEARVLQMLISELQKLSKNSREKILKTVAIFYQIKLTDSHQAYISPVSAISPSGSYQRVTSFSEDRNISPKEFILSKSPLTDVERIACLAYYLTHYRNQPQFKTLDLSKLNTEAAQIKFTNPAVAVDNAAKQSNFLISTTKGNKQISALGELYVQALPDRDEAKKVIAKARPKRKLKRNKVKEDSDQ
jgi:hypothetical protein